MGEKEKSSKKFITKETIISAVIGLVVGIILTCVVCLIARTRGMANLRYGKDAIASVAGKSILTEKVYEAVKPNYGLSALIDQVDKAILNEKYTLTEKEEKKAKEQADYYIKYYTQAGLTEQEFYEKNGFSNYDEFLNDVKSSIKSNKYLYDYLEKKLEPGAVQKYYDENKDAIETYDSEHILVKISDTVTDEQALALANEIITKLNEGKTFAEVVEEYKDQITHEELGYQGKTASLEQNYIDELVSLKDGEYSKTPIKTSYGYHIVHKLATSTFEDLRGTIIETLSTDMITADSNLLYKAFVELRKENNLEIYDEQLKKQYDEYCTKVYETTSTETVS